MTWGQIRLSITKKLPGADLESINEAIQSAYEAVLSERPWVGLNGEGVLTTIAPYSTGTASVSSGNGAIVGVGTAFTADMVGRLFQLDGDADAYTVATFVDAENITIDRPYLGDIATGQGFRIFQDAYYLPSDVRTVRQMALPYSSRPLARVDDQFIQRTDPARSVVGIPVAWAPAADSAETGSADDIWRWIRFYPLPDEPYSIPYTFRKMARGFDGTNVNESPFPWVLPNSIIGLAVAELLGSPVYADMKGRADSIQAAITLQQIALGAMRRVDNIAQGPASLRLPGE